MFGNRAMFNFMPGGGYRPQFPQQTGGFMPTRPTMGQPMGSFGHRPIMGTPSMSGMPVGGLPGQAGQMNPNAALIAAFLQSRQQQMQDFRAGTGTTPPPVASTPPVAQPSGPGGPLTAPPPRPPAAPPPVPTPPTTAPTTGHPSPFHSMGRHSMNGLVGLYPTIGYSNPYALNTQGAWAPWR